MLYKYTVSPRFFEAGLIRFSQPDALNDAYEAHPIVFANKFSREDYEKARSGGFINYSGKLRPNSIEERRILDRLMQPWPGVRADEKIAPGLWPVSEPRLREKSFDTVDELDNAVAERALQLAFQFANDTFGILSLTSSAGELLWAYYSSDHTGLRIGFDGNHPFFNINGRAVEYSDDPIPITVNNGIVRFGGIVVDSEEILNGLLRSYPQEMVFRKTKEWSHEEEWRVVRPLNVADRIVGACPRGYLVHLFSIPKDAVRDVTFGLRASDSLVQETLELIRSAEQWSHVGVFKRYRRASGTIAVEALS